MGCDESLDWVVRLARMDLDDACKRCHERRAMSDLLLREYDSRLTSTALGSGG